MRQWFDESRDETFDRRKVVFSFLPKSFVDEEVLTDASMEISAEYLYPLAWHYINKGLKEKPRRFDDP